MKLTKRLFSLLLAMLMLCSGMTILANAEDAAPLYTLNSDNCYIDVEKLEIVVKNATIEVEGVSYEVAFTATQSDDTTKTLRGLKDTENNTTIFTDPVTGKTYNVVGKITVGETAEVVTNTFAVEVLKSQAAPSTPVPKKITASSIEIGSVVGCEYRINGGEWVKTGTFSGLEAETSYTIEMRFAKTATHYASPVSSVTVTTLKATEGKLPALPALADKTNNSITVVEVDGVEFSIDNGKTWQENGKFTGLKAAATYSIIARYAHDATIEEANPATAPATFITNERESYPADLKNCTFKASEGDNYANESIDITVTADSASKKYNAQYGDTKYIPAYYTIGTSTEQNKFTASSDGKTFKASFIPGEANANKKLAVNVYYEKQKCYGENDNGEADWRTVGELEVKTYYVQVGEVHNFFTDVKNFFLGIFDFLFNTLPAAINNFLTGDDFGKIMDGAGGLLEGLKDVDFGALLG